MSNSMQGLPWTLDEELQLLNYLQSRVDNGSVAHVLHFKRRPWSVLAEKIRTRAAEDIKNHYTNNIEGRVRSGDFVLVGGRWQRKHNMEAGTITAAAEPDLEVMKTATEATSEHDIILPELHSSQVVDTAAEPDWVVILMEEAHSKRDSILDALKCARNRLPALDTSNEDVVNTAKAVLSDAITTVTLHTESKTLSEELKMLQSAFKDSEGWTPSYILAARKKCKQRLLHEIMHEIMHSLGNLCDFSHPPNRFNAILTTINQALDLAGLPQLDIE
ncbi:hypothetical protein BGZ65_002234 [Modicella reniformis]|uniref:Myb-like domain-containing protein n=1 Tax=Modicella reniformis TaxID=1440133 RepID=A0A9P6ILU9_9FUNG|nr:hypothetical protein BGZ65_002234 [Modicella reniformis]